MKFTREAALKIAQEVKEHGPAAWSAIVNEVAERVFDACQKAFEEERIALSDEHAQHIQRLRMSLGEVADVRDTAIRLKLQAQDELKIANGIVQQQNEQIAELRSMISEAHEFGVQTLCSVPDGQELYRKADSWLKRAEPYTTSDAVRKAFEADAKRQQPSFPPPGAPDPGQGYRLLDPEKDMERDGDEWTSKAVKNFPWLSIGKETYGFSERNWYRRKIEPAPVEPDPLKALLPKVNETWARTPAWQALMILIERELARTRKEQQ